jgi:hypothetical protein
MGKTTRRRRPSGKPRRHRGPKPGAKTHRPSHSHRQAPAGICRADASKTGFGDLPAELRNYIYEIALKPSLSRSVRIILRAQDQRTKYDLALGLLCTCKALRREAWPFLYEKNDFRIDCIKLPPTPAGPFSEGLPSDDHHLSTNGGMLYQDLVANCYGVY